MKTEKSKRLPHIFSRTKRQFTLLVLILVLAAVFWLRQDEAQPGQPDDVYGEIIFTAVLEGSVTPQIYHMTFNATLETLSIERLTNDRYGAFNGVYSPDGAQIVFTSSPAIYIMNADGSNLRQIARGEWPFWVDTTHIVFQQIIGHYNEKQYGSVATPDPFCWVRGPFVYDLVTERVSPLYTIPITLPAGSPDWGTYKVESGGSLLFYNVQSKEESCDYETLGNLYLPENPSAFHPIYRPYEEAGLLDHAIDIFARKEVVSPSGQYLARAIASFGPQAPKSIQIYSFLDKEWYTIASARTYTLAWSPDERYVIYSTSTSDTTSNIVITSVNGGESYTLFEDERKRYYNPSWRPTSGG